MKSNVTVTISTKDRYFTSLPNVLISIAMQTVTPERVIIFDDGEHKDLRNEEIYKNIFSTFQSKGIAWEVAFGAGKGQVKNHQRALEMVKTDYIWRLDDDNVAEANVLGILLTYIKDKKIGAVGGLVLDPKMEQKQSKLASNKIEDIYLGMNIQWFKQLSNDLIEVDHLYSTFLFRKEAAKHGYNMDLSPVGHREETMFTYEMKREDWKLLVAPEAVTWHYRNSTGGIRSGTNAFLWEHDEKIFAKKLQEWGVNTNPTKLIVIDAGLGDHLVFAKLLPDLKKKYKNLVIACCYNEVFEDEKDIKLISIAEAKALENLDEHNIYKFMWDRNWKKSIEEAYRERYL